MGERGQLYSEDIIDHLPIPREKLSHRRTTLIGALMKDVKQDQSRTNHIQQKNNRKRSVGEQPPQYSEAWARQYKYCFSVLSLRKCAALIGLVDLIIYCAIFARGVHLFMNIRSNPAATAWFVASSMILLLEFCAILFLWIGLFLNKPLWILPKIVMKLFELLFCVASISAIGYMVYMGSELVLDLIITNLNLKYKAALNTMKLGGLLLISAGMIIAFLQSWFMLILFDSYKFIREFDIQRYRRSKLRSLDDLAAYSLNKCDYNDTTERCDAASVLSGDQKPMSDFKSIKVKWNGEVANETRSELLTVLSSSPAQQICSDTEDLTIFMTNQDGPTSCWNSKV